MLFVVACTGTYFASKVVESTLISADNGDQERWMCTLHTLQAKFTYDITRRYQIWRLLAAVFLHNSFLHLFWNMFSFLMIGFTVEQAVQSSQKYLLLLLLGSYHGNVWSAIFKPYTIGVGASCTIFSLLGVIAIWFWLNYHRLGPNRNIFMVFFILIGVFSLMNVLAGANIDIYGHLGGLIIGLPLGVLFLRTEQSDDVRR